MEKTCIGAFIDSVTKYSLDADGLALRMTSASTSEIERFRLIWNLCSVQESEFSQCGTSLKNKELSASARHQANIIYREGNILEAFKMYKEAICTAPYPLYTALEKDNGSFLELAYSYANRSAVFYSIGQYQYSLSDTMRAVTLNYPERLMDKILERQGLCFLAMHEYRRALVSFQDAKAQCSDENKEVELEARIAEAKNKLTMKTRPRSTLHDDFLPCYEIPVVSGACTPKVPALSDAVELERTNSGIGQFIARRDIEPGEVIFVESPIGYSLLRGITCDHCLCNTVCPVPCRRCTLVVYCSEGCQVKAWDLYHKHECPISAAIIENTTENDELSVFPLKTAVNIVISTAVKFINEAQNIGSNTERKEHLFQKFITEESHGVFLIGPNAAYFTKELFTPETIINCGVLAAFTLKAILQHTTLLQELSGVPFVEALDRARQASVRETERASAPVGNIEILAGEVSQLSFHNSESCSEQVKERISNVGEKLFFYIGSAIMHQMHLIQVSGREINKERFEGGRYKNIKVGLGSYPHARHLVHSCCANALEMLYGEILVVSAMTLIRKGEPVTVERAPDLCYEIVSIDERRRQLKVDWKIACVCPACVERWPNEAEFLEQQEKSERMSLFICQHCDASVPQRGDGASVREIRPACQVCKRSTYRDVSKFAREYNKFNNVLQSYKDKLRTVTATVDDTRKALRTACAFIKVVEKYYRRPSQVYYTIGNIMRLCLPRLSGMTEVMVPR